MSCNSLVIAMQGGLIRDEIIANNICLLFMIFSHPQPPSPVLIEFSSPVLVNGVEETRGLN